ncbi:MAG: ATP-binding cassette domain-containing protein [Bacillota bacterium]
MKLYFSYRKSEPLIENMNISLKPGNIYGLLGRNGAGKTTLLKLISGLLLPEFGCCSFRSNDVSSRSSKLLKEIYFLPEHSYLPPLKASEYLKIYSSFYPGFDKERFYEFLDSFEIPASGKLTGLSFGQKKKFSIAFALASNTSLLLLDEPTNGLDIPAKSIFRKLVASSISEEKIFIVSTHQVKEMKNLIDPILIIDNGKIVFNEPVSEIEKRFTDIEELFNAVTKNREEVNSYFKETAK